MKFLKINYPTHRLKVGQRFKRTIVLEREAFHLSEKENLNRLYNKLFDILIIVFDTDKSTTRNVLRNFLNLKERDYIRI